MREYFQLIYLGTFYAQHRRQDNFHPTPDPDRPVNIQDPCRLGLMTPGQSTGELYSSEYEARQHLGGMEEDECLNRFKIARLHAEMIKAGQPQGRGLPELREDPEGFRDLFEIRRVISA